MYPLHFYRCPTCQTVATAPFKAKYGEPIRCLCRGVMKFLFTDEVERPQQRVIFNPHVNQEKSA